MRFGLITKPDVLDDGDPNTAPPLANRIALLDPLDSRANLPLAGVSIVVVVLDALGVAVPGAVANVALWIADGAHAGQWAEVLPAVVGAGNFETKQFALPQSGLAASAFPQLTNIVGGGTHVAIYWAPIGASV